MKRTLDPIDRLVEERVGGSHGPYDVIRAKQAASLVAREALRRFGKSPQTIDEQAAMLRVKFVQAETRNAAIRGQEIWPTVSDEDRDRFNLGMLPADLINDGFVALTNQHLSEALGPEPSYRIMGATMQAIQAQPNLSFGKVIEGVVESGTLPTQIDDRNQVPLFGAVIAISYDLARTKFATANQINHQAA